MNVVPHASVSPVMTPRRPRCTPLV